MMQEPKYDFRDGHVFNRASGEMIPDDEPVFVFRARDSDAVEALEHYAFLLADAEHLGAVELRVAQFRQFEKDHPERMKQPDTDTSGPEWHE